jgi:enoyl-CoA hydratase/carnithine racemase
MEGKVMADNLVLYETDEKVGIVTLNRPEKLNALSLDLRTQLVDCLRQSDADPELLRRL